MSYAEMNDVYADPATRDRALMCIREQAQIFANDTRVDIAELGRGVVRGQFADTNAIWSAIVTGPSYDTFDDDAAILSAVQFVWPSVADILYGHMVTPPVITKQRPLPPR